MEDDEIYMDGLNVTFAQCPDCSQSSDADDQYITFHTENNGIANFIWLETKRWAISEPEDIYRLAQRVESMLKLVEGKNHD